MNRRPAPRTPTLETVMARKVKVLYLKTMRTNQDFQEAPYLDMEWFKHHFATVAHQYGIYYGRSLQQYKIFFRLVWSKLDKTIRRMKKAAAERKGGAPQRSSERPKKRLRKAPVVYLYPAARSAPVQLPLI